MGSSFWSRKWFLIPAIAVLLSGVYFIFALDLLNFDQGRGGPVSFEQVELVQCPVCGAHVDPNETPYKTSYAGADFFFDSQECLDKFLENPMAYLKMRFKVRVALKGDEPASPSQSGTTSSNKGRERSGKMQKKEPSPKPTPRKTPQATKRKPSPSPTKTPPRTSPAPMETPRETPTEQPSNTSGGMTAEERAKDFAARQLVDHLYVPSGQMPVQDLVVDLDNNKISKEPPKDGKVGPNLQLSSRDKLFFKSPNKIRVDAVMVQPGAPGDRGLRVIIRDGTNRWLFVPQGQYPVKKGADEPSPTLALPFNIQRYPHIETNKRYTIVGKEPLSGIISEVVRIVDPSNPADVTTVWIDKSRWVPLKMEMQVPPKGQGEPLKKRVVYKDVRELPDGRSLPFLLEVYENNILVTVYEYKRASVNVGLQMSLFEPMQMFLR